MLFVEILLAILLQIAHPLVSGLKVGDQLNVKLMGRDRLGRLRFSRKALLPPHSTSSKTVHSSKQEQLDGTLTSEQSETENTPSDAELANKPIG